MSECMQPIDLLKYCTELMRKWPQVRFLGEEVNNRTGECCYTYAVDRYAAPSYVITYAACSALRNSLVKDGFQVTQTHIQSDRFRIWFVRP